MNLKEVVTGFLLVGPIVLVVSLVVSFLYSLIVHGSGLWDWELSIRLAIIFGIAIPIVGQVGKKKGP
jgi:hypothetical protein